ncbi:MAG: polyhydroxyalkanoate synthesis repressor PhaR [Lautropia sp.]|nr:polyhydroxyalkanoate synthesis repressor PhaR [Lautropia sp.]
MPNSPRLIKKYPNRRLYDTQTSVYITLTDVKQLVLDNESFQVVDAKTNEDLTRSILLQIILDEEAGGTPLFSSQMLAQMIRFYGHAMQGMMGTYLEKTLQTFIEVQNRMQEQSKSLYDGRGVPHTELWTQFMQGQAPMMQSMMSNYIDQSKNLFFQMQEQMQQQARNVFTNFPGAGFPAAFQPRQPDESAAGKPSSAPAPVAEADPSSTPSNDGKKG